MISLTTENVVLQSALDAVLQMMSDLVLQITVDSSIRYGQTQFSWFKKGSCQFLVKECAQILVNRLED